MPLLAVYIPPRANHVTARGCYRTSSASWRLHTQMPSFIVAGDFNYCNLRERPTKVPSTHELSFEGEEYQVYSNVKNTYKAVPRLHFGLSDHISVFLYPVYRQLLK